MYFEHPMPFHVAYPFTSFYDDEMTAQKDLEVMKSYYPEASRKIQQMVERECDRMEYDGSMVTQICRRISDRVQKESGLEPELLQMQESYRAHSTPIDDLVRILFCHEMFERRCRRRRARRYF